MVALTLTTFGCIDADIGKTMNFVEAVFWKRNTQLDNIDNIIIKKVTQK